MNIRKLWMVLAVALTGLCTVSCSGDDDDETISDPVSGGDSNQKEEVVSTGTAVDIGLSVLFADRNVGAKKVEDLGTLYAWGETETKAEFTLDNYFDRDFTKVTSDICGTEYDVAKVKWGGSWRMMKWSEVEEIKEKCTLKTITQNGVTGMQITGPNGNSVFMPYSYGQAGYYEMGVWTGRIMSNPYGGTANSAAYLAIFKNYAKDGPSISTSKPGNYRQNGAYVRPVCAK